MSFQKRVFQWVTHTFGSVKAASHHERCRRFFEEATELVQALGLTKDECLYLVDYVYGRDVGEVGQELGGVSVTLHALAEAAGHNLEARGEEELARVWTCVEKIRARNLAKMGSVRHEVAAEIAALAVLKPWEIYLHQNLESDLGFSSHHRSELMAQFLHNHEVDVFAAEAHGWRTVADVEATFNKYKDEESMEAPVDRRLVGVEWSVEVSPVPASSELMKTSKLKDLRNIVVQPILDIAAPDDKDSFYQALHSGDLTP